jgi:alpha-D-xyloside xylohydrolase
MKIKTTYLTVLLISLLFFSCSEPEVEIKPIKNGAELSTAKINVKVQFYAEDIVRVTKWLPGGKADKKSLSVIKNEIPEIAVEQSENSESVSFKSSKLEVLVNKTDASISYKTIDGANILAEQQAEFTPVVYSGDSAYSIKQNFKLTNDEGIYGLGQHQYGYLNYRGKQVVLVQTNTDAVNPFLVSTQKYGILWDNYSKTVYNDDGTENASLWSDVGDNIDYYFVYGEDLDKVVAGYRDLTGKAPMYGKYAYGYWQSKEHYDTQAELMAVAEKYRKLKIPIDNMIQDWDYWNGAENWSGMFFDKTLFPDPKGMMDRLHEMNYHAIISIWPALGPKTEIYADMEKNGFLYPTIGWAGFKYYDAYKPGASDMYWDYLKKGIYSVGLDGWWIDSTEPDVVNALSKGSTEYELKKMGRNDLGSFARYLNPFSLVMTDALHKKWREETSDRRAYILTRSTYAGQQRNAATTWSGDIGANWDVYKHQIAAGVNHSMSGIPYWTFDIGAFVIGAYDGIFYNGGKDPAYQELYARMFQLGVFTPIFRSHGSETPREIWEMGEFVQPLIKFDNLRYRLLPYIYSLAWKVTSEDYTIMRGLPMDFIQDKETYSIDDQFMFGPSIMVNPVTEYMYHRPPEKTVLVEGKYFKTNDGQPGLNVKYYKDKEYKNLSKEGIEKNINIDWYTGRPDFVTDSMYSIRWEGKLIPEKTGPHQFHMLSFDPKRIKLNGKELKIVYTSVEQYTEVVQLEAGKEYDFVLENENDQTGAARMKLFWKTADMFEKEKTVEDRKQTRDVYLPAGTQWIDFWTGETLEGGKTISTAAPIEIMPLMIKAGSIIPMGPFIQYSTEKPADPIELRIYPGANGSFVLYEDENDNYNYEKGMYATIEFKWDNAKKELTIGKRNGEFPGMLKERTIKVVIVGKDHGTGIEICETPDKEVVYVGEEMVIKL